MTIEEAINTVVEERKLKTSWVTGLSPIEIESIAYFAKHPEATVKAPLTEAEQVLGDLVNS